MKVLLTVEDDPDNAYALQSLLRGVGHQSAIASSPTSAADWLSPNRCDLILTDLFGRQHSLYWRDWSAESRPLREAAGRVPIIGVTGRVPTDGFDLSALGMAAMIPKPCDVDDLLRQVAAPIGQPRAFASVHCQSDELTSIWSSAYSSHPAMLTWRSTGATIAHTNDPDCSVV